MIQKYRKDGMVSVIRGTDELNQQLGEVIIDIDRLMAGISKIEPREDALVEPGRNLL